MYLPNYNSNSIEAGKEIIIQIMIVKATFIIIRLRLWHMHSSEGQTGHGSFKGLTSSGRTPQKKYKSRED